MDCHGFSIEKDRSLLAQFIGTEVGQGIGGEIHPDTQTQNWSAMELMVLMENCEWIYLYKF